MDININEFLEIKILQNLLNISLFQKLNTEGYIYCKNIFNKYNKDYIKRHISKESIIQPLYDKEKGIKKHTLIIERAFMINSLNINNVDKLSTDEINGLIYLITLGIESQKLPELYYNLYLQYYPKENIKLNYDYIIKKDVEIIPISKLNDFILEIDKLECKSNLFYRGHSNINYLSLPSLFRKGAYLENEYILYQELVLRCPNNFMKCNSHIDFLVEMQHYGLPTRLMDVTTNPLVALYFACISDCDIPGEVIIYSVQNKYLKYEKSDTVSILSSLPMFNYKKQKELLQLSSMNQKEFNNPNNKTINQLFHEIQIEKPAFMRVINPKDLKKALFVKPYRKNERVINQEGLFVEFGLMGNLPYNYNKNPIEDFRYKNSRKIIFAINNKTEILKSLNKFGINKAFLFPEIDDVSEYLKEEIT